MTDLQKQRRHGLWLMGAALGGLWFGVVRLISPQWSVYAQYNYGWAVPCLCAYLLWQRWRDRPTPALSHSTGVSFLLIISAALLLPTRIIAEANPIWRAASWAMALELVTMTLCILYFIGGVQWSKHFGFAIGFFLVAIPWPSQGENAIVQTLMRGNAQVAVEILAGLGVPALAHGNLIEISTGVVGIDEACSGIRSLQATLMIALFFGELYRLRPSRRTGLVLAGVGLAFACNMARTLVLVLVCSRSGIGALERWHDPTGIGILVGCFIGLWFIAQKFRSAAGENSLPVQPANWTLPALRFVPALLFVWFLTVEGGTAMWFGLREPAKPKLINWTVRWPTNKSDLREVELSQSVKQEMNFKEGKSMRWSQPGSEWQTFYFRWGPAETLLERVRIQCAKAHRPERCLPASGLTLQTDRGVKDFSIGDLTLPFRTFDFADRGLALHVYYCAWEDGTHGLAANMRENAASRLAAARMGSRSLSQRVLEIAVWGNLSDEAADAALLEQLKELIERH